ncbi:hypothetical protein GCM10007049_39090 [Echinicola pacifica]|uniref:Uncharacterized protein n=1 Tax=Echinicola pacifica TaxID=346377 RepID=A0A918QEQ9_9BACT|nr:hypothetical protein GCM10007049_39090 [Echinicola pacifica]
MINSFLYAVLKEDDLKINTTTYAKVYTKFNDYCNISNVSNGSADHYWKGERSGGAGRYSRS